MRRDLRPKTFDGKLARLIEECAELIKACAKVQRFGRTAQDPETKISYDNVADVLDEIKDMKDAIAEFEFEVR